MKKKAICICLLSAALIASPYLWKDGERTVLADEETSVSIDEEHFPDELFREYIATSFDADKDGTLSDEEISSVEKIDVCGTSESANKIKSLKGIEYFTELNELECQYGEIETLDLSNNTKLRYLSAFNNLLTEVKLGKNENLIEVEISGNRIADIDLSGIPNLKFLSVSDNKLTGLNLEGTPELDTLNCNSNELTELDVSSAVALTCLNCNNNQLSKLDLSNCDIIEELDCGSNLLTEINISHLKNLRTLYVEQNYSIKKLELPKDAPISFVSCGNMLLSQLDVSSYTSLQTLFCENNQITELSLPEGESLQYLNCSHNLLTKLDLTENSQLFSFYCESNKLTDLKVASYFLSHFYAEDNDLKTLDIRHCQKLYEMVEENGIVLSEDGKYYECYLDSDSLTPSFRFDNSVDLVGFELPKPTQRFEAFVERLYELALDRESDPEGKQFWIDQVTKNGATGADCARFFLLEAPEFMNRNLSNEKFLEILYRVFFDREADPEGENFYLGEMRKGMTKINVVECFINSKEWCDVCDSFGIESGAQNPSGATKKVYAFVERLYLYCMNRASDPEGLNFWASALSKGEATGIQAARFFFSSDEMKESDLNDKEYVLRLYKTFFDRDPEYDGQIYWLGQLKNGMTRETAVDLFAVSKEFADVCADYGIEPGTI